MNEMKMQKWGKEKNPICSRNLLTQTKGIRRTGLVQIDLGDRIRIKLDEIL